MDTMLQLFHYFGAACQKEFFGFPAWYKYIRLDNSCSVVDFRVPGDLVLVGLALVEILLRIAGLAAVFYVIFAGIQYALSQGNPEEAARAQSALINALIGLAVAVIAIAFVVFLGRRLG